MWSLATKQTFPMRSNHKLPFQDTHQARLKFLFYTVAKHNNTTIISKVDDDIINLFIITCSILMQKVNWSHYTKSWKSKKTNFIELNSTKVVTIYYTQSSSHNLPQK